MRTRRILRLRVTLLGSEPEIWRMLDVDAALTLRDLHHVLQIAFGWQESHLHSFRDSDPFAVSRGIPRIGRRPRTWVDQWSLMESPEPGDEDEAETMVLEAFELDGPLWYEYDFGDGWIHRIDLIERAAALPGESRATLVRGERRGPFEDSGGIGGYAQKLAIMADPRHPEHEEITDWARYVAGPWGSIDPEDADLDGARAELQLLFGERGADMSGLVDPAAGVAADSPIAQFASDLPVPWRANLRRHLSRVRALEPRQIDPDEAAELVRPYTWLIGRVGDGLTLTKAGWMPPAVVLEGMTELGWRDDWIGESNREDLTAPMHQLRSTAERLRLVRKVKGRLEVPVRVRRLAGDPLALLREIAFRLLRQRMDDSVRIGSTALVLGLADGTVTTRADGADAVIGLLDGLGYGRSDGKPLDEWWLRPATAEVLDVLRRMGLWRALFDDDPPTDALRAFARLALT
ncbi:plasmid pRiA4b ORF-3 family protein [Microbacterium sp.]|uniref:plasmid pRiA4b ORF-3 family protein n=1 Tax=Microbacterium sp. TaxID=51671 RepID=UPI0039E60DA5